MPVIEIAVADDYGIIRNTKKSVNSEALISVKIVSKNPAADLRSSYKP